MRINYSVPGFDENEGFQVNDEISESRIVSNCAANFWAYLSDREQADWQTSGYYSFTIFVDGVPIKPRKIAVEVEPHFNVYYEDSL